MSARPIKSGDLVMIVRHHCAAGVHLSAGYIFTVGETDAFSVGDMMICEACRATLDVPLGEPIAQPDHKRGNEQWIPSAWLKRIPPLTRKQRDEEMGEIDKAERLAVAKLARVAKTKRVKA